MMRSGVNHFWTPPGLGEKILGMRTYEDMIVIATTDGVYVIAPKGRGLVDHEVRKISHEAKRIESTELRAEVIGSNPIGTERST